jgi:outer membrane immunogenic protein
MKRILIAAAFAAIAFAPSARAGNLPQGAAPVAFAPYNWTGFYIGLNGGYGTGDTTGRLLSLFPDGNHNVDGGMFGAQIGFNYQMSNVVLGVEADWDWADINGSESALGGVLTEKATVKDLGTLRARLGYAWDRVLLYGTGGFAWSRHASDEQKVLFLQIADTQSLTGYALGLGVEYGITQNLSAKAEYLYVHLDPTDFHQPICTVNCSLGADVNVFRLGLNWRFSGLL